MATLLKVLNNLADIKSARGVALRVRTQGPSRPAESRRTMKLNSDDSVRPPRREPICDGLRRRTLDDTLR